MSDDDYDQSSDDDMHSDLASSSHEEPVPGEGAEEEEKHSSSEDSEDNEDSLRELATVRERPLPKPSEDRITPPFLTKYEKARILGVRATQIGRNSPIYVDPGDETDPLVIAEKELVEGRIPFIVRRYLPDNSYEDWPLKELKNLN
jgi:DNA-directed RNA polymerase I, II, and III subunit RPABC2